jgi:ubiquinone/menaquinone biosynthesis C-methylase UbiE
MKSPAVLRFDRTADGYLRWWAPVLAPASKVLIDRLTTVEPGLRTDPVRVADVGCGTGNALFEAAGSWPAARLIGIDASDGMLAVAERQRAALEPEVAARLSFVSSDAADLPLESGSIHVVLTAFALQHVRDRSAVLREFERVLCPGGVVGICGWLDGACVFAPDREFDAALADAGLVRPQLNEVRAGHYESVEQAERELTEAGFAQIASVPARLDHAWTPDGYLTYLMTTRHSEFVEAMEADRRAAFLESFRRRLESLRPEELIYRESVVSITARVNAR